MKTRRLPKMTLWLVGTALLLCVTQVAAAAEGIDAGWQLRVYAAAVHMERSGAELDRLAGVSASYGNEVGAGLGVHAERRFSSRLGLELGVLSGGNVTIEARSYRAPSTSWWTQDDLAFTSVMAGLDIHLTPEGRVDVRVCPLVALVSHGSLAVRAGPEGVVTRIDFEESPGIGAAVGIGVPLKDRWSLEASFTYLHSRLEGDGQNGIRIGSDYESSIFGIGVAYRFGGR